jgi:hypothetical protein
MNYPVDEIPGLLGKLNEERRRHLETHGGNGVEFETLVIPNAMPDRGLYADLEEQGVTSTVCTAWNLGDPAFAAFGAKRAAMEAFAEAFL